MFIDNNIRVLIIAIAIGGGMLGLLGSANGVPAFPSFAPPPVLSDRPWLAWTVYYRDVDGRRQSELIIVPTVTEAIKQWNAEHADKPDMLTCVASAYYNVCAERVW